MKLLRRNLSTICYCLYKGREPILDEDGHETGETRILYQRPKRLRCSVSPAAGSAQAYLFGNLTAYDKVLVTDDTACPIDENTVLFVDKRPAFSEDGVPLGDYRVRRTARSINYISYAISKVEVS